MKYLKLFEYWKPEKFKSIDEFEFRNLNPNDYFARQIIEKYELINFNIRETMRGMGLKIVVFDGRLTMNKELLFLKKITPRNWSKENTWDISDGCYHEGENKVFTAKSITYYENGKKITENGRDILLHEVGHAYDILIGKKLYRKHISEEIEKEIKKFIKKEPFEDNYYNLHVQEYIANAFDLYYSSDKTRNELGNNHTGIFNILEKIENEI